MVLLGVAPRSKLGYATTNLLSRFQAGRRKDKKEGTTSTSGKQHFPRNPKKTSSCRQEMMKCLQNDKCLQQSLRGPKL